MHAGWILLLALAGSPPWLASALWKRNALPRPGALRWAERTKGLETAELDASLGDTIVDRIHLVRVDPRRFRFEVLNDPALPATVEAWQERLGAAAVVNASFYTEAGLPETPIRSKGRWLGPASYRSAHGAFVAGDRPGIIDLRGADTRRALAAYPNAVVSYPLLLDLRGQVRAADRPTWIANRTFVAKARDGRVLLGTTETGFFSLRRLGRFLKESPLELEAALNLDGGPPACQVVHVDGFHKAVYGRWEANDSPGEFTMFWGEKEERWLLHNVLAVFPK
jgi:hypothetical protein